MFDSKFFSFSFIVWICSCSAEEAPLLFSMIEDLLVFVVEMGVIDALLNPVELPNAC